MLVFFMVYMLYYNVTIYTFLFTYFYIYKGIFMIALNRTHSKTALLCFAFLLAGAGCEQKTDASQPTNEVATTDEAHTDHDGQSHDDHEHGHDHSHDGDDEHSHEEDSHEHGHDGHHHDHDHTDMTTYSCQPEQTIEAHYDPEGSTQSTTSAHLLIDGVEYDLTAMTPSTNNTAGMAFETDIGITDDAGMRWQLNADATKAVLSNKTLDGSVTESNEAVLFDCQKTDS